VCGPWARKKSKKKAPSNLKKEKCLPTSQTSLQGGGEGGPQEKKSKSSSQALIRIDLDRGGGWKRGPRAGIGGWKGFSRV